MPEKNLPRMTFCLVASFVLGALALAAQYYYHGAMLALTLYKTFLAVGAGWVGYWLDRALFPYARPHEPYTGGFEQIRRAIIVAACVLAIAMGA